MTKLTRAEQELKDQLPHLFGWPWYSWAKEYYESKNRFNFLVAANQISKSSTQIRKAIHWATSKKLWPELWPTKPRQFWYLYPSKIVATSEFYEKWVPEFLPNGRMKEDEVYGWEAEVKGKEIWAIRFNSGVTIYFKSYEQDSANLQTSTVHAIFADEEMPYSFFQEIRSRLTATNGYFHMVFTATLGQDEWRRTMEPANEAEEFFKDALKIRVSMYDCLKYANGRKSIWTLDRIKEVEDACATDAEIQRRVHGRFVVSSGLKFPSFDRGSNIAPKRAIPPHWHIYSGVDIGSGGEKNHPAAIVFVAVQPDFQYGEIFLGWRGDGIVTTSSDILDKHQELCHYEGRKLIPVQNSYDWQARDFITIATRSGVAFTPAHKKRDSGENLLNTLFKLQMLKVQDDDPELSKLVIEFSSLMTTTPKTKAKDDFIDAARYAAMSIPWDFQGVKVETAQESKEQEYVDDRSPGQRVWDERKSGNIPKEETGSSPEDELAFWQDCIDG